jgi:Icc-related predicted phosphoesterase
MLLISDVHGEFDALAALRSWNEPLLVLGDLLNLLDYRTGEGITADVLGRDFAVAAADARASGDFEGMRRLWRDHATDPDVMRAAFHDAAVRQYEAAGEALDGIEAWVTYGNVDRPALMQAHLPSSSVFVDGDVIEIGGVTFGFVGGGIETPLGAQGEVSDGDMRAKLRAMGPVDVLCSHLPPAVEPLYRDVVTGRLERGSEPILEYLRQTEPLFHFFGDVHQPQASQWRVGRTTCRNVGYFRATKRAVRFDPAVVHRLRDSGR